MGIREHPFLEDSLRARGEHVSRLERASDAGERRLRRVGHRVARVVVRRRSIRVVRHPTLDARTTRGADAQGLSRQKLRRVEGSRI